jgi:(4S)-4-hydroxy-5-phosphonooxypentane-2,3-dione isomerase
MPRLAIIVEIEVAPGRRDQLLPLLMAHRTRCLRDEPGITLQLDVLVPYDSDTKVLSYEIYRDDGAFEVHRNGSSTAQFREDAAGMIVKMHVTKYAPQTPLP